MHPPPRILILPSPSLPPSNHLGNSGAWCCIVRVLQHLTLAQGCLPNRDRNGRLVVDPTKFPTGNMSSTAAYVHSKGLKFGLWFGHTMCAPSNDTGTATSSSSLQSRHGSSYPATLADYAALDAAFFASNGVVSGTTQCVRSDSHARARALARAKHTAETIRCPAGLYPLCMPSRTPSSMTTASTSPTQRRALLQTQHGMQRSGPRSTRLGDLSCTTWCFKSRTPGELVPRAGAKRWCKCDCSLICLSLGV